MSQNVVNCRDAFLCRPLPASPFGFRRFKNSSTLDTEYDRAKVLLHNGSGPTSPWKPKSPSAGRTSLPIPLPPFPLPQRGSDCQNNFPNSKFAKVYFQGQLSLTFSTFERRPILDFESHFLRKLALSNLSCPRVKNPLWAIWAMRPGQCVDPADWPKPGLRNPGFSFCRFPEPPPPHKKKENTQTTKFSEVRTPNPPPTPKESIKIDSMSAGLGYWEPKGQDFPIFMFCHFSFVDLGPRQLAIYLYAWLAISAFRFR